MKPPKGCCHSCKYFGDFENCKQCGHLGMCLHKTYEDAVASNKKLEPEGICASGKACPNNDGWEAKEE